MADQDTAHANAIQLDALPMSALDGLPLDSASFAKAFTELVQASIEAEDVPQASLLIVSMRALVIGLAALFRKGGGAGHMDPIDAFLSMYGSRIYDALAKAVDHEAAAVKCSVEEYIQSLREGPCQIAPSQPSGTTGTASGNLRMVPVAEASPSGFRMLYCDSMSIHSSDAEFDGLAQDLPESFCAPVESSMPEALAGQPVAEATEWTGGWGDDWEEPVSQQETGADGASAGWGADGWGECGEWMDAPVATPTVMSAAQQEPSALHAPEPSTSLAVVNASAPINAAVRPAQTICDVAAGEGTDESNLAAVEHPRKVVKKKIIKKVVKKVVRRKVRTGMQSTDATDGASSVTPDAHKPASLVQAVPVAKATGTASAANLVVPEPLPLEPEATSCVPGFDVQPLQSDGAPIQEVQPTDVLGFLPNATGSSHHEPDHQDLQFMRKAESSVEQHQGCKSPKEQREIVAHSPPMAVAGLISHLDTSIVFSQSVADDGAAPADVEEENELTCTTATAQLPSPDAHEDATHGSRVDAINHAPAPPDPDTGTLLMDLAGAGVVSMLIHRCTALPTSSSVCCTS